MDFAPESYDFEGDPMALRDDAPVAPPKTASPTRVGGQSDSDPTGGGKGPCPKDSRCAWKYTAGDGRREEGHSEWMCSCRAEELAVFGCQTFGKDTHWVQVKDKGGA